MFQDFDLEKFLKISRRVQVDDLPWEEVPEHPLTNGEVRFLSYMMNIESHTIVYLCDLLSTSAIEEPDVTAFLSCWAHEEFFHGYYLEKFLKLYIGEESVQNDPGRRLDTGGRVKNAIQRLITPALTAASPDFAATHMAWGASQEYTTLHGYEALARQSRHPVLKELMARIVKDERRHFAFYYKQAQMRLERSPFMQKETRWFMDKLWRPVGANVMPPAEMDFIGWYLFRDEQGLDDVRAIDDTLAHLPGMHGWTGLIDEIRTAIANQERCGPAEAKWAYEVREPAKVRKPMARAR